MNLNKETIVALSTAPGQGAIAVIRLSGPDTIKISDIIFKGCLLQKQQSHTVHFGNIEDADGAVVDEVLVSLFIAPRSYTKENVVEISCHGSPYVINKILKLCLDNGARLANPGEFTLRAFLNGRMDLSQAEAVADLIASESKSEHDLAIRQMRGGFSEEIKKLRQELIDFAALIELELDFGEEDVEFANREDLKALVAKIQSVIKRLMDSFSLGNVIKTGVSTVIAGRPNAGKSTLLNALLNEERAIVSDIAGTTRDTVEESLNISGVQFRLIDTAGIRAARDKIEKIGVDKTIEKISLAKLVIYVFDVTESSPEQLWNDVKRFLFASKSLTEGSQNIFVANKMDLNPFTKPEDYYKIGLIGKGNLITVSAKNKMNIEYLKEVMYNAVVNDQVNMDDPIVSNTRHLNALEQSYKSLEEVTVGMSGLKSSDLVAMDIRQALHYLGEITGEISSDDLLDSIFSRFCIGK